MGERYVVKLASGEWLGTNGFPTTDMAKALTTTRAGAYHLAANCIPTAVALRLKPSARAAELAKLRAEVEELRGKLKDCQDTADDLRFSLDARTDERDALAAQLAALPPDVTDEELITALLRFGDITHQKVVAREARRLLRGPVAPARPVKELRDELVGATLGHLLGHTDMWDAVAKRARELGAR